MNKGPPAVLYRILCRRRCCPPFLYPAVLLPRYPVSTVGPSSSLAHPSQHVWLSHAHHETLEQSEISKFDGRSVQNIPKAAFAASRPVACLVGKALAEALTATGGLLPSPTTRDPRHA